MMIQFPASKRSEVLSTFAKIVKKSGNEGATCEISDSVVEWKTPDPKNPSFKVAIISAEIEIPSISGWHVIAKLDAVQETGANIIRSLSHSSVPKEYWHGTKCDHCNVNRYRKESFLLVNQVSGVYKQVGSTCLDDFTNGGFNHVFFREIQDLVKDCDDWCSGGGGYHASYPIEQVLAIAEGVINAYGWVPSAASSDTNPRTSARVWSYLNPGARGRDESIVPSTDLTKVKAALEWVRAADAGDVQYLHNLIAACALEYVEDKNLGIVTSLVPAFARIIAQESAKKNPILKKESKHVGALKERRMFKLTLTRKLSFEGFYGMTFWYIMKDDDGNMFKWSTGTYIDNLSEGDTLVLKGTVKEHTDFKGTAQTILSRCVVESNVKAALDWFPDEED